jgi:simple sugar transport system substrate-binding protein
MGTADEGSQVEVVYALPDRQRVVTLELPVEGLTAAQDMLTANPGIVAIYGACGPPIIGALQAIKAAGKQPGDIVVIGFDASPDEVAAIKAGDQTASIAQFPAKMGLLGIETAVAAARGETVEPLVDTGTEVVTIENADQFA